MNNDGEIGKENILFCANAAFRNLFSSRDASFFSPLLMESYLMQSILEADSVDMLRERIAEFCCSVPNQKDPCTLLMQTRGMDDYSALQEFARSRLEHLNRSYPHAMCSTALAVDYRKKSEALSPVEDACLTSMLAEAFDICPEVRLYVFDWFLKSLKMVKQYEEVYNNLCGIAWKHYLDFIGELYHTIIPKSQEIKEKAAKLTEEQKCKEQALRRAMLSGKDEQQSTFLIKELVSIQEQIKNLEKKEWRNLHENEKIKLKKGRAGFSEDMLKLLLSKNCSEYEAKEWLREKMTFPSVREELEQYITVFYGLLRKLWICTLKSKIEKWKNIDQVLEMMQKAPVQLKIIKDVIQRRAAYKKIADEQDAALGAHYSEIASRLPQ